MQDRLGRGNGDAIHRIGEIAAHDFEKSEVEDPDTLLEREQAAAKQSAAPAQAASSDDADELLKSLGMKTGVSSMR